MGADIIVMPEKPCPFCGKNEATQLCDFVVDYLWTTMKDQYGNMMGRITETCDNPVCKECSTKIAGHDICPSCKPLYDYVQKNHKKISRVFRR